MRKANGGKSYFYNQGQKYRRVYKGQEWVLKIMDKRDLPGWAHVAFYNGFNNYGNY